MAPRPAILGAIAASGRQYSSLFRPPPRNVSQKNTEVLALVELLTQLVSNTFVDDISELVRSHYPCQNSCLVDDVLATFILHHPEHTFAVLHAVLSCVIDGTLIYDAKTPPFTALGSIFNPCTERDFPEKWALACGEILRLLTHYNRPSLKIDSVRPSDRHASPSTSGKGKEVDDKEESGKEDGLRRAPSRQLTPWITDSLLAADHSLRNDYFRWCGGVTGQYASGEALRPPTIVGGGNSPQSLQSAPRWAVANGAAVILSVCDDEVARHGTADLTGSAVPALLIRPPPTIVQDEYSMALGVPPLEPYAPLFQRYYANALPRATERLLLRLLETPPHGILVTVALVNILKGADDSSSSVKVPHDWLFKHFLSPAVAAFATKPGIIADEAAALLYHIFSQPALLVPAPSRSHPFEPKLLYGFATDRPGSDEANALETQSMKDSTASDLAAVLVRHGPAVERRISALWDAALGLQAHNSSEVELPKFGNAPPLQPPAFTWNMVRPLLQTLEHLPQDSESNRCLRRLYTATVHAILQRTFPQLHASGEMDGGHNMPPRQGFGAGADKAVGMAELRAMVHCLFTESSLSPILVAQLLSDALILCINNDAKREAPVMDSSKMQGGTSAAPRRSCSAGDLQRVSGDDPNTTATSRGAVATFDSYVVAAVCALACEVRMLSFLPSCFQSPNGALVVSGTTGLPGCGILPSGQKASSVLSGNVSLEFAVVITRRLGLLELLLTEPQVSSIVGSGFVSRLRREYTGNSMVASHLSKILGRSKACLHALTEIMKCEWDRGICAQAAAVVARLQKDSDFSSMSKGAENGFASSGIKNSNKVPNLENEAKQSDQAGERGVDSGEGAYFKSSSSQTTLVKDANGQQNRNADEQSGSKRLWKQVAELPLEASDIASLLCKERWNCPSAVVTSSLLPRIVEKPQLAIDIVALLCKRLFLLTEVPINVEGGPSESGWHRVVEAVCSVVTVLQKEVTPFVVGQADIHLQPWTTNEHLDVQKSAYQVNGRILGLLAALLRMQGRPSVVMVVVQDRSLLRRATDGLTINGEASILPQLELLEAGAIAAHASLKWDEPQEKIADALFTLLKERLPATVRCLSHSSARVRDQSIARLRDTCCFESRFGHTEDDEPGEREPHCNPWRTTVQKCITWEVHYRLAGGMSTALLTNAAHALELSIPS